MWLWWRLNSKFGLNRPIWRKYRTIYCPSLVKSGDSRQKHPDPEDRHEVKGQQCDLHWPQSTAEIFKTETDERFYGWVCCLKIYNRKCDIFKFFCTLKWWILGLYIDYLELKIGKYNAENTIITTAEQCHGPCPWAIANDGSAMPEA